MKNRLVKRLAHQLGGLFLALALVGGVAAASLQGTVRDTNGQPVDGVLVTVEDQRLNATTISVLSDSQGRFEFPELGVATLPAKSMRMLKVGYAQQGPIKIKPQGKHLQAAIVAAPLANVAEQVSGSAWISRDFPDTPATHMVTLNCAQCHDLPFAKAKQYIGMFGDLSVAEKEKVWRDVFKFMRMKSAGLNPAIDLSKLPVSMFEKPKSGHTGSDMVASWSHDDEDVMAPLLARHMSGNFADYKLADYQKLAAPVGTVGTIFREYQMPGPFAGSLWHDTTIAKLNDGRRYIYSMDWGNPRLARIDPRTGEIRLLPLPRGASYGHTLAADGRGNLMAVLQNPGSIGRFDPVAEKWEIWPAGGPQAGVHSFAYKAGYYVGYDAGGGIWASLIAQNKLVRLDPRTGETRFVDGPPTEDADPAQVFIYGGAMTADGKTVWFTQLNGGIFGVDTASGKIIEKIDIPRGEGPRRLTIDKDDVLYVPLDGAGRILVYDTKTRKEIGRYALPDWAAGPYALNWDPTRNAVWTVGRNGKVYRFNIADKSFVEYPFPRQVLVHALSVDNDTGDVYFSYGGTPQIAWSPRMVAWLHPGEPEARPAVALGK